MMALMGDLGDPPERKEKQLTMDREIADANMTESERLLNMFEANPHQSELITHPVLATFLEVKWTGPSLNFIFQLILWLIFSVLLTVYIGIAFGGSGNALLSNKAESKNSSDVHEFNNGSEVLEYNKSADDDDECKFNSVRKATIDGLGIGLMVITFILVCWEALQMIIARSIIKYLFKNIENVLQLFLFISTMVIVIVTWINCKPQEEYRHLAALCIVLTWTLILFLAGNRWCSTYIAMFRTVAFTYSKLMFFTILIVAYGIAFYIMLHR